MKRYFRLAAGITVALLMLFFVLRVGDTDAELMMQKYGGDLALKAPDGHGGSIHYRDQGPKDAPVLLLIHGSNASLHTWEPMIKIMMGTHRLISFDQHGHGLTGPHPQHDYSATARVNAGLKVLDAAGVKSASWVGNSMGGWVAWRAALEAPDRVSSLVLIDASGAQTDEKIDPYIGAKLARTTLGQLLLPHITPKTLVHKSLKQAVFNSEVVTEEVLQRYWELLRFPGNRQAGVKAIQTGREPEKWQDIGDIRVPTLILWGEHDTVVPLSHASAFAKEIENSRLITYEDAAHLPMEEKPKQVAKDICIWLSELSSEPDRLVNNNRVCSI